MEGDFVIVNGNTPFREAGGTTRAAFVAALSRSVSSRVSPVADEASAIYDVVHPAGLDRIAAAMAWRERHNDSNPDDYSYYGPDLHNLWATTGPGDLGVVGRFGKFSSYVAAAESWVKRLLDPNGPYAGDTTIAEMLRRYAPKSDGNDEAAYLRIVVDEINALPYRAGPDDPVTPKPPIPDTPVTFGKVPHPPFQDRSVTNSTAWDDLGPRRIVGTCLHSMVGSLMGTDGYFRGAAAGTALTDYGIGGSTDGALDGVIFRWNDPRGRRAPWANGPTDGLEGDGSAFVKAHGGNSVNRDLVSIERSDGGNTTTPVSAKQLEAICQLMAYWHDQAKVSWNQFPVNPASGVVTQLQHWELGRKECPFPPVRSITDTYQARVRDILKAHQTGGDTPVDPTPPAPEFAGLPRGMTAALLRERFPLADPTGPVTARYIKEGARTGVWPAFGRVVELASGTRRFEFEGGLMIYATPTSAGARVWLARRRRKTET